MGRNYKDMRGGKNPNFQTGLCTSGNKWQGYNSWCNMKARCSNPKHPKYPRYGGRGIKICNEWMAIKGFYEWAMANGYKQGLTIDRINNDGDYTPENCRWVSASENSRSKSTTKLSFEEAATIRLRAANGENERDLAREYNVTHGTIWFIVKNFTHTSEGAHSRKKEAVRAKKST